MRGHVGYNTIMENFYNVQGFQNGQGGQGGQGIQGGQLSESSNTAKIAAYFRTFIDRVLERRRKERQSQEGQSQEGQIQEGEIVCNDKEKKAVVSDSTILKFAGKVKNKISSFNDLGRILKHLETNTPHPLLKVLEDAVDEVVAVSIDINPCGNNVLADVEKFNKTLIDLYSDDDVMQAKSQQGDEPAGNYKISRKEFFNFFCTNSNDTILYNIENGSKKERKKYDDCYIKHIEYADKLGHGGDKNFLKEAHEFQKSCAGPVKSFFVKYRGWFIILAVILLIVLIFMKFRFGANQYRNNNYGLYGV